MSATENQAAASASALSHIRVLGLSRVLAGPWASQTLGDLGAAVIKVERPGMGGLMSITGKPDGEPGGGPVNTVADVFADPQVQARGMQMQMEHPQAGSIPLVASPIWLSDTPVQYRITLMQPGQHTREVLGLSSAAIDELSKQGVLG